MRRGGLGVKSLGEAWRRTGTFVYPGGQIFCTVQYSTESGWLVKDLHAKAAPKQYILYQNGTLN